MSVIYCSLKKFTNEENVELCAICRKNLKKNDLIYQCPNCSTFFHQNHLQEWLKANSECPVCRNTLIVLMSEDEEEKNIDHSEDETLEISEIDGVQKEDNKMMFLNPILKPRIPSIIFQIIILTAGLLIFCFTLFDFTFGISVSILRYESVSWMTIVFALPFFFSSFFIIILGVENDKIFFSYNWQNLELNSNKIVVISKKFPKEIELFPNKIRSILIETYEDESEEHDEILEDLYCLRLEIINKDGKKYHFTRIFENISSSKTERVVQVLEEFLMEKYSIQISAFTDEMEKKRERIRILCICIGSILLLSIILTRIYYF
ncbi:MAG: RING finger domain-containing protein [Candidatus Heimdallarchaeota archaeon]